MAESSLPPLLESLPWPGIVVNDHCQIQQEEGSRVVLLAGIPVFTYEQEDRVAEDLWVAQAVQMGHATQAEVARALGRTRCSVHRAHRRYEEQGAVGLGANKRGPKGPWKLKKTEAVLRKWHQRKMGLREMSRRLHAAPGTVFAALKRLGLPTQQVSTPSEQLTLGDPPAAVPVPQGPVGSPGPVDSPAGEQAPGVQGPQSSGLAPDLEKEAELHIAQDILPSLQPVSQGQPGPEPTGEQDIFLSLPFASQEQPGTEPATPSAPLPMATPSMDSDPLHRPIDRLMAALGLLDDAAPLFAPGLAVPCAGVLLALPVLTRSGLLETGHKVYQSIGPAFYGLRTSLLAFVLFALLRIKRAENLKQYNPADLGRVLGLDRAPEVKTLRRKLVRLAEDERADSFIKELVPRRVESHSEAMGYLYVDGHVRVYHGQHKLPKTHACRLRLSLPATQDVWVNDAQTTPVLVITQPAHPQLVSALPPVLKQIRRLVGDRRVTVVFDRGGWSPKLFRLMDQQGFDVLTYHKGAVDPVPGDLFTDYPMHLPAGPVIYQLHQRSISLLNGTFWMRQVIRQQGDHQTAIVTTRQDLEIQEVARRMFGRWGQENFFKYMRQEYALDALVQYGTEQDDPTRLVPNPARKVLDRQLTQARKDVTNLEAAYGAAALDNSENKRPTMRGFKIAHGADLGIPLREARLQLDLLAQQRKQLPTRVPIGDIQQKVVRLKARCKRFSDALKMLSYQIETDLLRVVALLYPRCRDEGRRLLMAAFLSAADLDVAQGQLRITLAPQSSPHRTEVVAALCELLNETETCFPGTSLMLRFAIHRAPPSVSSETGG